METRGRSKRSQASQPAPEPTKSRQPAPRRPRVTKAAKPTKAQAAQPAEPDHGDDGIGSDDSQSDGLHTPVPHAAIVRNRRGAAAEGAASPPSIVPAIQSSGDTVDDSASQAAEMEKNQADLEEVRLVSLPDLSKAADDVAGYLRRPDHNNGVSLGLLSIKRDTLFAIRERYVDLRGFPFIQWVPSIDMERDTFEGLPPTQIIGRVNLVAALELIFQFNKDPKCDRLRILEMLDEFFPKLVEPFGYAKPEALARALDIRSLRIIERIEWLKGRRRQMKTEEFGGILARVFCEPFPDMDTPGAIAHALSHGPFKILGVHGESDEKTSTLFSERAKSLLNMFKEDKKNYGLPKLREEYPTGKILDEAFAWALSFYDETAGKSSKGRAADGGPARKKALQHRRQSGHDEFHDANEEPEDVESEDEDDEDDEDDDIESQEIVRAGGPQM